MTYEKTIGEICAGISGFAADWMRPTLKRLMPQGTQCPPPLQNGLLKF